MSIIADILTVTATRLSRIHLDNGYSFEVPKIWIPQQDGQEYSPQHLNMVVTAGEVDRDPELDRPGNPPAIAWILPIQIHCDLIPSRFASVETFDELATLVHSNIIQAITQWPVWHQFDARCINATIERPEINRPTDDGGIGSVKANINATYRVSETRPEQIRG